MSPSYTSSGNACTAVMALRPCANVSIEMAHVAVLYGILT